MPNPSFSQHCREARASIWAWSDYFMTVRLPLPPTQHHPARAPAPCPNWCAPPAPQWPLLPAASHAALAVICPGFLTLPRVGAVGRAVNSNETRSSLWPNRVAVLCCHWRRMRCLAGSRHVAGPQAAGAAVNPAALGGVLRCPNPSILFLASWCCCGTSHARPGSGRRPAERLCKQPR